MTALELPAVHDYHCHVRQGELLSVVAPWSDRLGGDVLCMPNLQDSGTGLPRPVEDADGLKRYQDEVGPHFKKATPLFAFALTPRTTPARVRALKKAGAFACKVYPDGVTTHSGGGIPADCFLNWQNYPRLDECYRALEDEDVPCLFHPELPGVFCLDRERLFLPYVGMLLLRFARLRVVLEHITTADSARFVLDAQRYYWPGRLGCTVTAHHLALTLDDVVGDRLRPHNFCKPLAKRAEDREALWELVLSGSPSCWLGPDSAAHWRVPRPGLVPGGGKECDHGCAGVWSAPVLIESLAAMFEQRSALDKLAGFVSVAGSNFYGRPARASRVRLGAGGWRVPEEIDGVVPWLAGETLPWRVLD